MKTVCRQFLEFLILACALLILPAGCGIQATAFSTPTNSPTQSAPTFVPTQTKMAVTRTAPSTSTAAPDSSFFPVSNFNMSSALAGWGTGSGRILRSVDGGQSWQDQTPPGIRSDDNYIPQVWSIDAQTAWVLVPEPNDLQRGRLYRTSDSGQHWQDASVPFGGGSFTWLNARTAWVLADRGVAAGSMAVDLYHTQDGGATWGMDYHINPEKPDQNGLPFGGDKTGVAFRDPLHGWVTGTIPMEGVSYLYATADGGKTWSPVQLALPAGLKNSQLMLDPPRFFDEKNAVLPAHLYHNGPVTLFYLSQDGGMTWSATQSVPSGGLASTPDRLDFVVWDGKTLYTSRDAGQTWKTITPNINLEQKLSGLQFSNAQTGWALSSDGQTSQFYRSVDGGQTWKLLNP